MGRLTVGGRIRALLSGGEKEDGRRKMNNIYMRRL
jgi:hypothetical protein